MTRAAVNPGILTWARTRAGLEPSDLHHRFPKLDAWEAGEAQPTLKQLDAFAHAVHVPVGYLFLQRPPDEPLPIPDFRTMEGRGVRRPSPNLLDMLYACQERQGWYREFALTTRQDEADFVGSATLRNRPEAIAADMTHKLDFDLNARAACRTWEEALRLFISQGDRIGVLVMVSGVVLSNNNRKLDPEEFRGFALADRRAPLIFINGADTKSGQMFTLAHELAHLWLGSSAISDAGAAPLTGQRREEVWCNAVAAELLVPMASLGPELRRDERLDDTLQRLARRFKVSTLVILRRLLDADWLDRTDFDVAWENERRRLVWACPRRRGRWGFLQDNAISRQPAVRPRPGGEHA